MTPFIQVVTTLPDQQSAETLAAQLLEQRLAACIQISPCTSWFRWQGAIEQSGELVCTIKTHRRLYTELEKAIRAMHPYEVPEILATPIVEGGASYLRWLSEEIIDEKEND